MITAAEIAKKLKKARRLHDGSWQACCPNHDDKNPSLSLKDGDHRLLWHCHGGCDWREIQKTFVANGWLAPREEYEPQQKRTPPFDKTWVNPATHIYRDRAGAIKYIVKRMPDQNGGKTFRQFSLNGAGTFKPTMEGVTRVPYLWHLWHDLPYVVITEGEQGADACNAIGIPATCNPGGAGQWQDELTPAFKDKQCIIIPDNDDPGHKHAQQVAEKLHGTAGTIIMLDVCQGMERKADIVDYIARTGADANNLWRQVAKQKPWTPGEIIPLRMSGRQWFTGEQIQIQRIANWAVRDMIPTTGLGAVYGKPGSGKTFWALDLAMHIASSRGYLNKTTKPGIVIYVALESGTRFHNRIVPWCEANDISIKDVHLHLSPTPLDLRSSKEQVEGLIADIQDIQQQAGQPIRMVIVDTLSRAMAGGNENSPEDMTALVGHCDTIWKTLDTFMLLVHHTGKDDAKGLRGHSSLLAAVDTEIEIKAEGDAGVEGLKIATILKQRDGIDGLKFGFMLDTIDIGPDSDAEMMTTCIINHFAPADLPEPKKKELKLGVHQNTVLQALRNTLVDQGVERSPGGGRPVQLCCTAKQLRDAAYPAMAIDSQHRNTAFNRASAALVRDGIIGFYNELYWVQKDSKS